MTNKFLFRIISADGKVYSDSINELYINNGDRIVGILYGHYPLISKIDISIFKIKKDDQTKYFAISGGILNVERSTVYILADTFEESIELDKERIIRAKKEAEEELTQLSKKDEEAFREAEFSLKKAINRLRLIK
jgi:ATP synthase, F1 epsilon subunit (delta in mitochondria)